MRRFYRGIRTSGQVLLAATLATAAGAPAQTAAPAQNQKAPAPDGGHRGQFAGMGRVAGEVTAVAGNTLTLKTEDGSTVQVVTTDNTRLMKDRGPVKVTDLHPGDGLMAFGNMDTPNHTLHAAMVMAEDAAQVKAMRENLGKTYITGRVTAVNLDDAKMTVERPDHVAQTIGLDESTSFKRAVHEQRSAAGAGESGRGGSGGGMGRGMADPSAAIDRGFANGESITLADIKAGDFVLGTGSVKAGVFVPTRLLDSPPGQRRQRSGEPPAAGTASPAAQPGTGGPGDR